MTNNAAHGKRPKPTRLFWHYVTLLIERVVVFGVGIWLFFTNPTQLDIANSFGIQSGLTFTNVVFVLIAIDFVSKLRPHAQIAMGSRKQYGEFHVPTPNMFDDRTVDLPQHIRDLIKQMPEQLSQTVTNTRNVAQETAQGVYEASRQFAYSIDVLRLLPWPEEDLTASERMRDSIRRKRAREVIPVIVFWVVFNFAIGLVLDHLHLLRSQTVLLWTLFYFVFDMICVVLWCPLQLLLMRNRCCTTCQIFNWDGIMTVTPLLGVMCWFTAILIAGALVVLVRWELAFARHPERFDQRTNASLLCKNCTDKLCYLRKPFTPRKRSDTSEGAESADNT